MFEPDYEIVKNISGSQYLGKKAKFLVKDANGTEAAIGEEFKIVGDDGSNIYTEALTRNHGSIRLFDEIEIRSWIFDYNLIPRYLELVDYADPLWFMNFKNKPMEPELIKLKPETIAILNGVLAELEHDIETL